MKKSMIMMTVFLLFVMGGCTRGHFGSIESYKPDKKEQQLLKLGGGDRNRLFIYKVTLEKDSRAYLKVSHYKQGEYIEKILSLKGQQQKEGSHLFSVGVHDLGGQGQSFREWFADIGGDLYSHVNFKTNTAMVSVMEPIHKEKKLSPNEYTTIGVFAENNRNEMRAISADDPKSIDRAIKENDDVYVISYKAK